MTDITTLADLTPDPQNARKHTPRNVGAIVDALHEVGAARSIVIDEHGTVLAGNATVDAAGEAGIERVRVIDADGEEIIAVRRRGLTDAQKKRLAYFDNRSAELAEWDGEQLARDLAAGVDFDGLFNGNELATLLAKLEQEDSGYADTTVLIPEHGYRFGDVDAGKLAFRVEAAWRAEPRLALELYAGIGQLTSLYERRFERVVRVDRRQYDERPADYVCKVEHFLAREFGEYAADFDFIDFDDDDSPLYEVQQFFAALPQTREKPFVLCITDGSGLTGKLHGLFAPALYCLEGPTRRHTAEDYAHVEELVQGGVQRAAHRHGWAAECWSSTRGSGGSVVYQTYQIQRASAA